MRGIVFIIFQCNVELCIYDFPMYCVELVFRVPYAVWICVFINFYALRVVVSFEFPMQCVIYVSIILTCIVWSLSL